MTANKDALTKNIEKALKRKWREAEFKKFTVTMKATGNEITIRSKHVSTHYTKCGGYVEGKTWFEVTGDGIEEARYFKTLAGLAKSMAYGYIK